MSTLHPHWHTTDDEELPVRVTDKSAPKPPSVGQPKRTAVPRAKRGPAAFIGVALFLAAGFAVFQGVNGLTGQSSNPGDMIVRITEDGVFPAVVTVRPGDSIRWSNESAIPHILESETLSGDEDEPFKTTAIFPGSTYDYLIPAGTPSGTHDYVSQTAVDVMGQIIIEGAAAVSSRSSQRSSIMSVIATTSSSLSSIAYVPPAQASSAGGIPQNPYTISSADMPLPPPQNGGSNVQGGVMEHMPVSTSSTGMEVWVMLVIGVAALAVVWRKATH